MYGYNGKQVLHVQDGITTHIADAGDTEMAHAIATRMNQASRNYILNAKRTLSPAWHGDKVSMAALKKTINDAIDAANKLDQVKKSLFYGRDNNLMAEGLQDSSKLVDEMAMPIGANAANVFHAIVGKFTEAGELLEALRECYNGEVFDRINAIEEVGDGFWYDAILLDEMDSDFEDSQSRNINKLQARFPDKFASVNANERNLEVERAILETGEAPTAATESGHALDIVPTKPVGGEAAVADARKASETAFDKVAKTEGRFIDQTTGNTTGELHLSPAARKHPLADEVQARQPVDPRKK